MKSVAIACFTLLLLSNFSHPVWAGTILQKIARTGEVNLGARKDAIPFGYVDERGKWTGYSVNLLELINRRLQEKLKKFIKIKWQEATVENRFELVRSGKADMVCGAATITQERLKEVDFSIPYFMTGAQFLVKQEDGQSFNINGTLANIPIAYIPRTTTQFILPQIYPFAHWQPVRNRQEGVEKLKKGEVKAVVSDGILLIGELVRQGNNPRDFVLTPQQPITAELYGCILPQNDPEWKKFIDDIIVSKENRQLQEQWFNFERSPFPYTIYSIP